MSVFLTLLLTAYHESGVLKHYFISQFFCGSSGSANSIEQHKVLGGDATETSKSSGSASYLLSAVVFIVCRFLLQYTCRLTEIFLLSFWDREQLQMLT